jgi:hypothetical protein
MVNIGGDGTTTVRKLEGFQISLRAKRSHFMASGVPSLDLLSIQLVISNGPHRFPGHDANSVTDRLRAHTTDCPSHILCRAVSALSMSVITRGPESTQWRIGMTHHPRGLTTLELPINEELEANLLALHDTGRQEVFTIVGVKKMSSSCFATDSVFDLKSHPRTGTRER